MTQEQLQRPQEPSPGLSSGILSQEQLEALFPYDAEYVLESGLLDLFYYDEETGENGLLHTLVGTLKTGADGGVLPEGFHHEPSAQILSPRVLREDGVSVPVTRVVTEQHIKDAPSKERKKFIKYPMEPSLDRVVINGLRKFVMRTDPVTGEKSPVPVNNSMYPREYDPLAVLQAIRIAYEERDLSKDELKPSTQGSGSVIVNDSEAPLLDGVSHMTIRIVMDPETHKIHTAYPIAKPVMRLTEQEMWGLLTTGTPKRQEPSSQVQ